MEQENMMQSANKKYRGLIGLQMEGENKETYALTPYLVLYVQVKGTDETWITLKNSRLDFPLVLDDLTKEFERLIDKIESPAYEDEIGY